MGRAFGKGDTDYERYIKTQGLYALMRGPGDLVNDDELLFQVTHMAMELWLAVVIETCGTAARELEAGKLADATRMLNRASGILDMLGGSLRHVEAIRPWSYHAIRVTLGKGSGQQSPTFNELLVRIPALAKPFDAAMARHKLTVDQVQQAPDQHPEAWSLVTAMLLLDEHFMRWRYQHYQMVQRIIGNRVMSLVGIPASALERHAHQPCFPDLWDSINRTTGAYNRIHGAPGDSGAYTIPSQ